MITPLTLNNIEIANDKPFVLFGGMNVLESRDLAMRIAEYVGSEKLGIPTCLRHPLIMRTGPPFIRSVAPAWSRACVFLKRSYANLGCR